MQKMKQIINILVIITFFGGILLSQNKEISADSLIHIANSFQNTSKWDSARFYYFKSLRTLPSNEDFEKRAIIFKNIGNGFIRLGNLDSASVHLTKSEFIYNQFLPDQNAGLIKVLNSLAVVEAYKNDYNTSNDYFSKALRIHEALENPDKKISAKLNNNIGANYERLGNYPSARKFYDDALQLKIEEYGENHKTVASTIVNIGSLYFLMNNHHKAIEFYTKALGLDKVNTKTNTMIKIYHHLGLCYSGLEDYKKSEIYFNKALFLVQEEYSSTHFNFAKILLSQSNVKLKLNDSESALELCKNSINIYENYHSDMKRDLALSYFRLSKIYLEMENYQNAQLNFLTSLEIYTSISENLPLVADIYSNLAEIDIELGNLNKSELNFQQALKIRENIYEPTHPIISTSFRNLGDLAVLQSKFKLAESYYIKSLNILVGETNKFDTINYPNVELVSSNREYLDVIESTIKLQEILINQSTNKFDNITILKNCLRGSQQADLLISNIQKSLNFNSSKQFLTEKSQEMYDKAIYLSNRLFTTTQDYQFIKQALIFSESSRALVFWSNTQSSKAKQFGDVPSEILEFETNLTNDITYLENQKFLGENTVELNKLYFSTLQTHDSLITQIEQTYPKYYNLKYSRRNIDIANIQSKLPLQTAIVEYFLGSEYLYIFTITHNSINMHQTKIDEIPHMVNELVKGLKKMDFFAFEVPSNYLFSKLILPIISEIESASQLIIIPSGELYFLPFEVLAPSTPSNVFPDFTTLDYLIKTYNVSYNLSANQFNENKKTEYESQFIAFAPVSNFATFEQNNGLSFSTLPNSVDEIIEISEKLSNHDYTISNFINTNATEMNLKTSQNNNSQFLHIATHGIMNNKTPELSALYFYNDTSAEDNILYASEIYNLRISTDLVVLSSCESGVGKLIKGEGLLSISRSFLYAGAENIMFSLWKVSDEATSQLMNHFYSEVIGGNSYSNALRNAKLEMISNSMTAYPRNWSSFVLIETN